MQADRSNHAGDLIAGILVGGASRRMGRPKATIDIGGETLLSRTVRVARDCACEVVLLGSPSFPLDATCRDLRTIPDPVSGIGPIAGLAALLEETDSRWALLLACDMPFIEPDLIRGLINAARETAAVAVVPTTHAGDETRPHPCCALYDKAALPAVRDAIAGERYGMRCLLDRLPVLWWAVEGDDARLLANWNRPSDVVRTPAT